MLGILPLKCTKFDVSCKGEIISCLDCFTGLLGFLMAFITSTNYNRWLQARAGLCDITILCVDIASRADVFLTTKDEDGIRARKEMARYLRLLYTSIILTLTDSSLWGGNPEVSLFSRDRSCWRQCLLFQKNIIQKIIFFGCFNLEYFLKDNVNN